MAILFNPFTGEFTPSKGGGGGGNAFTIIQPDSGTSPTATTSTSTLTVTSQSNSNLQVVGDSTTNTLSLLLSADPVFSSVQASGNIQTNAILYATAADLGGGDITNLSNITAGGIIGSAFLRAFSGGYLQLDSAASKYTKIAPHAAVGTSYTVRMPQNQGTVSTFMANDGSGNLSFSAPYVDPTVGMTQIFEDFCHYTVGSQVGTFALFYQGSSATDGPTSSEKNRIGVVKFPISSGATSAGFFSQTGQIYLGGATVTWAGAINVGAVPTGTDDYLLRIGLSDGYSGVVNGCWFTIDRTKSTTNWYAVTSNGGTATSTNTSTAIATGWVNLRIEVDSAAASAKFYINGTLVATNSTNLPAAGIGPWLYTANVASAVVKTTRIDWVMVRFTPSSTRGTF